ncbi:MarR family transcriptional regulator [Actinobacillus seminis]|uniref:MarR family transcriptional regulator n=1 Tax=Actinobacillus seminis TaxID=722 RepID=A0A263HCR9_9PAST|nr:MarR family winged helix-turn-helix transcriptional regulator [Actinobacillus seminis]OZN24306.1 MarR family transcriptional regulator [Actinobacillus seminis]SUU34184.1 transcriptional regulator SlyA [Actinobacillus seminis]
MAFSRPYLTYQFELLKNLAIKAANPYYEQAAQLRVRELRVLRLIHDTPGVTATELRHKLVLDKTLLSKNLAVLEERGLICYNTDPQDNRVHRLQLTEKGTQAWKKCEKIGRDLEAKMFGELSIEELEQLQQLLHRAYTSFSNWHEQYSKFSVK